MAGQLRIHALDVQLTYNPSWGQLRVHALDVRLTYNPDGLAATVTPASLAVTSAFPTVVAGQQGTNATVTPASLAVSAIPDPHRDRTVGPRDTLISVAFPAVTISATSTTTERWPRPKVEVAFVGTPSTTTSWTDITDDVAFDQKVTIRRGRSFELDEFSPGTCRFTILDRTRRYDPLNTSSDLNGYLVPWKRVRVTATFNSTSYTLFTGFIPSWPQSYAQADNVAYVEIAAVDELARIARVGNAKNEIRPERPWILDDDTFGLLDSGNRLTGPATFDEELSGARVTELLSACGVPTARQSVDVGRSAVMTDTQVSENPLQYLQRIAATEHGRLLVLADGTVAFWDRDHPRVTSRQSTSQATYSDATGIRYADLTVTPADDRYVKNLVRRGAKGGADVAAADSASISAYGTLEDSRTDLLFSSTGDATDQAKYVLSLYKDPRFRVESVELRPGRTPTTMFPEILARELGDRVTVTRTPLGTGSAFTKQCWVEAVSHVFDSRGYWQTVYALSAADINTYWKLDSGSDALDSGYLITY